MKTDPPFSGPSNVVQVGTKRLGKGKMYLRTPYKIKYKKHPSTPISVK
jgi:hypothetical protein